MSDEYSHRLASIGCMEGIFSQSGIALASPSGVGAGAEPGAVPPHAAQSDQTRGRVPQLVQARGRCGGGGIETERGHDRHLKNIHGTFRARLGNV
jgi:hypothetical protein